MTIKVTLPPPPSFYHIFLLFSFIIFFFSFIIIHAPAHVCARVYKNSRERFVVAVFNTPLRPRLREPLHAICVCTSPRVSAPRAKATSSTAAKHNQLYLSVSLSLAGVM